MKLTFIGQSGFVLESGGHTVVIDPFLGPLEDEGERKRFPRLVEPPVTSEQLGRPDLVLVSHHHGDHCHVGTLLSIARHAPACRFVVTRSARDALEKGGLPSNRMVVPAVPGWLELGGVRVFVVPSRHYEFSYREDAVFDYFGYVVDIGGRRTYSAGDTVPFAGLYRMVADLRPDIGILPVNGRDPHRESQGIVGNLTPEECVDFSRVCRWTWVVPCHFGMFSQNTADVPSTGRLLRDGVPGLRVWIPELGETRELQ